MPSVAEWYVWSTFPLPHGILTVLYTSPHLRAATLCRSDACLPAKVDINLLPTRLPRIGRWPNRMQNSEQPFTVPSQNDTL